MDTFGTFFCLLIDYEFICNYIANIKKYLVKLLVVNNIFCFIWTKKIII